MKKLLVLLLLIITELLLLGASGLELRRNEIVKVVEKVKAAVVNIGTEQIVTLTYDPFKEFRDEFFFRFFPPLKETYKLESLGSGVIVDSNGYILTNEHVISSASKITVSLLDGRKFTASVVGATPKFDLAVLKIKSRKPLPTVKLGTSSDLMIGETVIAIGNPYGLNHTVTVGVISAVNRSIRIDENKSLRDLIQTDASINPGNSGGPLLNILGELIGINTAIYKEAQGIGFAIPIDKAKRIMHELINFGKIQPAYLGVSVQKVTRRLARMFHLSNKKGLIITEVAEDSPAYKAGLAVGDIILSVYDKEVNNVDDFYDILSEYGPNHIVKLKIFRNGNEFDVKVKLSYLPINKAEDVTYNWLGFIVNDVKFYPYYRRLYKKGVIITKIKINSKSYRAGLRKGDVILQVNNKEIENLRDFNEAILLAYRKKEVFIIIARNGNLYYVTL